MKMSLRKSLCFLWLIPFVLSCETTGTIHTLSIAEHTVRVELAATDKTRSLGLMHRDSLPEDSGMLFVFERPGLHSFWMKNTRIPLAIAFIDRAGIIVNIEEMKAYDETPVYPQAYVLYTLEMNAGWFAKKGIVPGMRVHFDDAIMKRLGRQE